MKQKEFVRVIQNEATLIKRNGFKAVREMLWIAKMHGLEGKFQIEYLVRINKDIYKYAVYTFKDFLNVSAVFPHGVLGVK